MEASRHIENLIYTYAEHIDAGNLEAVAELFRGGEILAPAQGSRSCGYEDVLAMYQAACRVYEDTGTPKTKHLTTNVIIDVNDDRAEARSYFTVIQAADMLPLQPIICGRYEDSFRCQDGQWQFAVRSMFVDHIGDCSAHLLYGTEGLV